MATFSKRGTRWRAQVSVNGTRKSKTFPTKSHAQAWASMIERDNADISIGMLPAKTVADLLERYDREVSVNKGGERWEHIRINKLLRDELATVSNRTLSPQDVAGWRDRSLKKISGASVNREWNLLSAVFTKAVREWGWLKVNPMKQADRPKGNPARTRRPTQDEIDLLLSTMQFDNQAPVSVLQRLAIVMLFAIETAMRTSELCNMQWKDVGAKMVHLPKTKNGHARDVPLSKEARRLLELLPKGSGSVFDMTPRRVDANFRRAKKLAGVEGLNFHDFRREALTRLAKKLDVMELARMSGHRDLKILLTVYYTPNIEDLADKLD